MKLEEISEYDLWDEMYRRQAQKWIKTDLNQLLKLQQALRSSLNTLDEFLNKILPAKIDSSLDKPKETE